jgi:hypothetical protein
MPSPPGKETHDLEDFADLLRSLSDHGFPFTVIGGCAVGAYARLMGKECPSRDLDLYTDPRTLETVLSWAPRNGLKVLKCPQPRSPPVAVLEWQGLELNIVLDSFGLPDPSDALRVARVFELSKHGGLEVMVADALDLLRNKLAVNRPKDRPHIEILREFVEKEAVEAFEKDISPRARILPARQYMDAIGSRTLPEGLAARWIPLARTRVEFRFLLGTAPAEADARAALGRARALLDDTSDLEAILAARRFPRKPLARPRVRAKPPRRAAARG